MRAARVSNRNTHEQSRHGQGKTQGQKIHTAGQGFTMNELTETDHTYPGGARGLGALCSFIRSHYSCIAATIIVLLSVGVTVGLTFINKKEISELSTIVDVLKRDLNKEQSKTAILEQRLHQMSESPDTKNIPSSCPEVAEKNGFNNQTFYVIDPDGPERGVLPMVVQCDVQEGTVITLIGHNSEARAHVKGFDGRGAYFKDVTYWNIMEQVRAVVDKSTLCKQHIKYECHRSVIFGSTDTPYAWWVTWDGRKADYWGGASPGSGKCACGQAGTCPGRCNCAVNNSTWREDSGFLSHKDDLPVTQLRFGDTGDSGEEGYYTLGKLICYP
ncbi:contactin-associated protein-like 5 [Branchiostoma floridae x Branchiostoma japonicum]